MRRDGLDWANAIALGVPLALILGALGSQFLGGLIPCEMCMWQRWPHYAAIPVAALALFVRHRPTRLLFVCFAAVLVAVSGAIGVYHAGVEWKWWEGITLCSVHAPVGGSTGDPVADVMRLPPIRCDEAQFVFLGLSLAGWNAVISFAGAIAVFALAVRRPRGFA